MVTEKMSYKEAAEVLRNPVAGMKVIMLDGEPEVGLTSDYCRAIEVALEALEKSEPVVHAHWEDEYGGKYANPRYRCSACKEKALYKMEQDLLLSWHEVQALTPICHKCGAHMDEEVADG